MDLSHLEKRDRGRIASCFLFQNTDTAFIEHAIADSRNDLASFKKGDVIFGINEYRQSIGIVLSGTIEVKKQLDDVHKYIMNTLGAGDIFGVAALFHSHSDYVTTLTASSPCRVFFIPQEALEQRMRENYLVAENYIRFLSERVYFLNKKIESLVTVDTGHAVAHYLMDSAALENGRYFVHMACSISALADMLNIGRASLYRSFEAMEKAGLIARNGRNIEILDFEGLSHT